MLRRIAPSRARRSRGQKRQRYRSAGFGCVGRTPSIQTTDRNRKCIAKKAGKLAAGMLRSITSAPEPEVRAYRAARSTANFEFKGALES
jgi:hypothetical protein